VDGVSSSLLSFAFGSSSFSDDSRVVADLLLLAAATVVFSFTSPFFLSGDSSVADRVVDALLVSLRTGEGALAFSTSVIGFFVGCLKVG